MDLGNIPQWAALFFAIVALGATLYGNLFSSAAHAADDVMERSEANRQRLDRHDLRIASIEADMRHLPAADVVHRLEIAVARLEGHLGRMEERLDERLKPLSAVAERWQDFMAETRK